MAILNPATTAILVLVAMAILSLATEASLILAAMAILSLMTEASLVLVARRNLVVALKRSKKSVVSNESAGEGGGSGYALLFFWFCGGNRVRSMNSAWSRGNSFAIFWWSRKVAQQCSLRKACDDFVLDAALRLF